MPFVELEQSDGSLLRKEVSFEERRKILIGSDPICRYIKNDGTVVITLDRIKMSSTEDDQC